jgi:DNA replicative helicase MCM subunit Mcm2 (Cdc46/Mcm family)
VDELIDALTDAAHEAVETAAGEAAKAAAIASLQSQAAALAAASQWEKKYNEVKKNNVKNIVVASLSCFALGAVVSGGTVLMIRGR